MNQDKKNNQGRQQDLGQFLRSGMDNVNELSARSYGSRSTDNSLSDSDEQSLSDLDEPMDDIINDQSQDQDRNKNQNFIIPSRFDVTNSSFNQNSPKNSSNNSPPSDTISSNNSASDKNSKQKSISVINSRNSNSTGAVSDGVEYAENLKEKANDLIVSIIANLQYLVKNDIIDSVKALNQITNRFPPSENTFEYLPLHEEPSKLSTRPFKPYYAQVKNNKS